MIFESSKVPPELKANDELFALFHTINFIGFFVMISGLEPGLFALRGLRCGTLARMDVKRETPGIMGSRSVGREENPSRHKAHEVQPPAAARAARFAAKRPSGAAANQNQYLEGMRFAIKLPAPASASGSGERRLREWRVSAACGADRVLVCHASLLPSTL